MNGRIATIVFVCTLCCAPAWAQTYAAAAVGADLARSYESTSGAFTSSNGNGEVVNWGLRVGTAISSQFGVELEFVRPGEIEIANGPIIYAAATLPDLAALGLPSTAIFPSPDVRSRQRNSTWNTSAWVRKSLTASADLVFLGGVGFSRVVQEIDYRFVGSPLAQGLPRTTSTRTTSYGVGPLVGAEARIHLTDHVLVTPGLRVQSLGNNAGGGLVIRPSAALAWSF
jgi:hypothetical protein